MLGKVLATSLVIAGLTSLASCGDSATTVVDCTAVKTPKTYSQVQPLLAKCTNCHSASRMGDQRHGATVGYDYDTFEGAQAQATLGGQDIAGTGPHVMPPIGQNCPAATGSVPAGPKCAVDGGGAVPSLTDQESQDLQTFFCNPTM